MCGIVSILSSGQPIEKESLDKALLALQHRGPDGQGTWVSGDRLVALGHTRLSIIDREGGSQPLTNEDGTLRAIVNGEFYDFEAIRYKLERQGHFFQTRSDSEILIHLYEEYGTECLKHLRGEFAFVLWNEKENLLFAARDRFGAKPLCYSLHNNSLCLASEAKALFALGVPACWNYAAYFHAISLHYTPPDQTLFQNIAQLPPGHYLLAKDNNIEKIKYWDLDYPPISPEASDEDEQGHVFEVQALLEEAVRVRLRADVPVACYLSGGIDSASTLGLATKIASKPLPCFSIGFDDDSYDERNSAQEMASSVNATFHPISVSSVDLIENLADAVYYSEGLAVNAHLSAKFILSREVQKAGYKVIISGEGSDEIFGGYPHLQEDLNTNQLEKSATLKTIRSVHAPSTGFMLPNDHPSLNLEIIKKQLTYIPSFLKAKAEFGYRMHGLLSESFRAKFQSYNCYDMLLNNFDTAHQLTNRSLVNQSLYLWSKLSLANYILRILGDGTEMSHSVEGRLPFLDHHLFRYVRNIPLSLKIKEGREKYILREAMRPFVTETIYKRSKHPFVAPPLLASEKAATFLQDICASANLKILPFFDLNKVSALVAKVQNMSAQDRRIYDPVLMMVATSCILQERYRL